MTLTLHGWYLIPAGLFLLPVVVSFFDQHYGMFAGLTTVVWVLICWPAALAFIVARCLIT